ncbi:hypothetical protein Nocox_36905 [Nonomuraea coxensis DSM 45129]|uniref:Uncharacterized protein n=1 Tax=Nonomuraea coxensis DSM 45129 TaxID=1122611 RepID=A0ABX8UAZ8_9ACTN|nr:hypothetical protein [Nonomuraea coxensis]QYC44935.1 hypothetical protein Nocox_36905 [Nonomuraea coxensis DSM 45129]
MSALDEALADARRACEAATDEQLMAFGRAINSVVWTDDTMAGALLGEALFKVPLATYVARAIPGASLEQVLAAAQAVMGDG